MKIGLVGAGIMGHGIGVNLIDAGHDLHVTAHRNRAPIEDLVRRGATEVATIEDLARSVDNMLLCVTDSGVARSVIEQLLPGLRAGALVLDLTTNAPEAPPEFEKTVARAQAHYIEAPVTGGSAQARDGVLGAIVGCDPALFESAKGILEAFCKQVEHFGPPGMGARAKLVSNFLALGTATLVIETFRQARALGVDWRKLYDLAQLGAGNSGALRRIMEGALHGDFDAYAFSLNNTAKDLTYFSRLMAEEPDTSTLLPALLSLHREAKAAGHGDLMLSRLLDPDLPFPPPG